MDGTAVSARDDVKILGLIGSGHFLSHFYMLCLPPLFPFFKTEFGVFAPLTFGLVLDLGRPEWVFYLLAIFMVLSVVTAIVPKGSLARD